MPHNQPPFIGIDFGATKILAGLLDESGHVQATLKELTIQNQEALGRQFGDIVEKLLTKAACPQEKIAAIGVGSIGPLDPDTGVIIKTPNMPIRDFPLVKILQDRFHILTFLDNDVNCGTLGEAWLGAGKGKPYVVGIFPGTGVGGGIILNGSIYQGANKNAGEIGHMIIDMNGPLCGCGGRGHLEAFASKTAMAREFEARLKEGRQSLLFQLADPPYEKMDTTLLRPCLEAKDEVVVEVLEQACHALAVGCISLIHILGPDVIVLGGGIIEAAKDFMLPRIRQETFPNCMEGTTDNTEILPALLGDDAVIIGAVAMAKSRLSL